MVQIPVRPSNSQFTDEQWQSVYDGGTNLLISASAGSGKTTVLVERVIQKIKSGISVDELLIVTYTEAAAKEMKARIQTAVQEAVNQESNEKQKQHLIKQLSLLPTANISTLHAFCLQVIRKYYYLIDIDPVFRLLTDETESILLREDVWFDLREKLYGEDQEIFYQLTENFSNDRSDDGLTRLIFSLHQFATANPDPIGWLDSLVQQYDLTSDNMADIPLYQTAIRPSIMADLVRIEAQLSQILRSIEGEPDFAKTLPIIKQDYDRVCLLQQYVDQNKCDELYDELAGLSFARMSGPTKKNGTPEILEIYEHVKTARKQCKEAVEKIKERYFAQSPQEMLALMRESEPLVAVMSEVAKKFLTAFRNEKAHKNVVDFNDLEHFTLDILAEIIDGTRRATEASTYYRQKFKEVLVDEYQDINQLQENILFWLRQPNNAQGNLFMVGDVKQSIYAFRLADPTLFIDKYTKYATEEGGRRIILAENFRSRAQVLDFTNFVFMQLMTHDLGQIDYDDSAALITGYSAYPEDENYETEILIYESQKDDEEVSTDSEPFDFVLDDKTEGELLLVGQKIKKLINSQYLIYRKKEQKATPISYKDIVLLTPTKKNNLVILDVFKQLGIPLLVNDTQNYFQATEIKIMVSLLQMIDNPYQDISTVSVLRSPIVGLKENELAEIRQYQTNGYFYDALFEYLQKENVSALYEKVYAFIEQFNTWRDIARRESLATLIWRIYEETGLLDFVGGMPSGRQRQANLHALYERATAYEEMNFKGLFQFVRLIEKMQEKNRDLAEPNQISDDEDAVRVMTIHASKGLEFPVVFVIDTAKQFNLQDINQTRFIFDEHLGAGIKYLDRQQRILFNTLPFSVLREEKRKRLLAEEMRKLYVALTRAEQKLYLVGSYKSQDKALEQWQKQLVTEDIAIDAPTKLAQRSLMDWVGMTLVRHPEIQKEYPDIEVLPNKVLGSHPMTCSLKFIDKPTLLAGLESLSKNHEKEKLIIAQKPNPQLLKEVIDCLDYAYPNSAATKTTSYQSVSEIKRVFEDPDNQDLPQLDVISETDKRSPAGHRYVNETLASPTFMQEVQGPTGADIGTATHLLMQLLPLEQKPTETIIKSLLADTVQNKLISAETAEKVDCIHLATFFDTPFGMELLANHASLKREQPFSILIKPSQLFSDGSDKLEDTILVHGIIDGYYINGNDVVLYDYKTDYISDIPSENELSSIKKRYQGQMNLYKLALSNILKREVTVVKLVLLRPQIILDI